MILMCGGVLASSSLAFRHSRAISNDPSVSTPGRAVALKSRRLTGGMAERVLTIFGERRL